MNLSLYRPGLDKQRNNLRRSASIDLLEEKWVLLTKLDEVTEPFQHCLFSDIRENEACLLELHCTSQHYVEWPQDSARTCSDAPDIDRLRPEVRRKVLRIGRLVRSDVLLDLPRSKGKAHRQADTRRGVGDVMRRKGRKKEMVVVGTSTARASAICSRERHMKEMEMIISIA